jgi:hypothetical protein
MNTISDRSKQNWNSELGLTLQQNLSLIVVSKKLLFGIYNFYLWKSIDFH